VHPAREDRQHQGDRAPVKHRQNLDGRATTRISMTRQPI
jgi:hypothetical protein